jgi:hypothetical protein
MRHDNALNSADPIVSRPPGHGCGGVQVTRFGATPCGRLGAQVAGHIGGPMRGLVKHWPHCVVTKGTPRQVACGICPRDHGGGWLCVPEVACGHGASWHVVGWFLSRPGLVRGGHAPVRVRGDV